MSSIRTPSAVAQPAKVQSIYLALRTWTGTDHWRQSEHEGAGASWDAANRRTLETQSLHIAQALTLCGKTLADAYQPKSDRAIALWIAHLVADAHQPFPAGSFYMEKVFVEEDGDRGANRIITKQRKNMHALWDQLLGDSFMLNGTRKRIVEITSDN